MSGLSLLLSQIIPNNWEKWNEKSAIPDNNLAILENIDKEEVMMYVYIHGQKVQTSRCKIKELWGWNIQHGDYSQYYCIIHLKSAKRVDF